ncbi:MAG: tetratricopeptide repeat protein [Candidatus Wallbacteria bacterium]|nr:tetratricopeptide repeat protein [Candidatus Wallbacteria bacterium]
MPGFKACLALTLLIALPLQAFSLFESPDVKAGNLEYRKGNFDEALKCYLRESKPGDSWKWHFNLGDTFYKKGDFQNAATEFAKSHESANQKLKADSLYNTGNVFFQQKDFEKAKKCYIEALKNYQDRDFQYNLQRALEKITEQQQQKQDDKNQDKDQKQDKQDQKQDQNQDQKQDQKQNDAQNKENEDKKEQNKDEQEKSGEQKMSEQIKEQFLESLKNKEKEVKDKMDQKKAEGYYNDKDW